MRADLRHFAQPLYKILCDNSRFQRPEADSLQTIDPGYRLDQINQCTVLKGTVVFLCIRCMFKVKAIGTDMDTRQNDLLIAVSCQCLNLLKNIFHTSAADASSCIRDNAVGTKLIASILDLNIGTGMFRYRFNVHCLIFMIMGNICHISIPVFRLPVVADILFNNLYDLTLHIVADDQVDHCIFF